MPRKSDKISCLKVTPAAQRSISRTWPRYHQIPTASSYAIHDLLCGSAPSWGRRLHRLQSENRTNPATRGTPAVCRVPSRGGFYSCKSIGDGGHHLIPGVTASQRRRQTPTPISVFTSNEPTGCRKKRHETSEGKRIKKLPKLMMTSCSVWWPRADKRAANNGFVFQRICCLPDFKQTQILLQPTFTAQKSLLR